jgi:retron-type reverse transcriptase
MAEQSNLPEGTRPATRQELYDLIRRTSREEFILRDMKRLGFWPDDAGQPTLPELVISRETELNRELGALLTEKRRLEDQETMLKELRKQRLAESRQKREETRRKREQARKDKAADWQRKKQSDILYLGEGVSGGLNETATDPGKLAGLNLPVLTDAVSVAQAMQVSVGQLRFLAFSRQVSRTTHYQRFYVPKKTGGERLISAPMPRLKAAQTWILTNILDRVPPHEAVHGFLPGRSIVTNATPHVGAGVVINLDLKDFFPSITYRRVKGVFRALGYSESVATILSLLCTEPQVDRAELDGETWYVSTGERHLPQGSPASPAITNILCATLDRRLQGLGRKLGFAYTRYADDLTFSASGEVTKNINTLKNAVKAIIESEDLTPHPDKTRIMREGSRKEVTGVVVNDKPGVDRKTLRRFRALLHQIELQGPQGKKWAHSPDLLAAIEGYANFVLMVDAEKGKKLKEQVKAIAQKYGDALPKRPRKVYPKEEKPAAPTPATETVAALSSAPVPPPVPAQSPAPEPGTPAPESAEPKKTWWKLWKK